MKLGEFQAGYKALGAEIAKLARADIFDTTEQQRTYILAKLDEMSKSVLRADKICKLLDGDGEPKESPSKASVTNIVNQSSPKSQAKPEKTTEPEKEEQPEEQPEEQLVVGDAQDSLLDEDLRRLTETSTD